VITLADWCKCKSRCLHIVLDVKCYLDHGPASTLGNVPVGVLCLSELSMSLMRANAQTLISTLINGLGMFGVQFFDF
jgi:hypothetical protein